MSLQKNVGFDRLNLTHFSASLKHVIGSLLKYSAIACAKVSIPTWKGSN
ncbi:hypothetical protein IMPERIA89_90058 [Imperialibacter sp. 89]|nr:hypothetical protein IMPERIA75_350058 [Imperialibacter sp. 75]CAD5300026.1 hypothetical protein IMPERIA89_90058 [Imperialibacter sp. 89]